jgi:hypothetical protein
LWQLFVVVEVVVVDVLTTVIHISGGPLIRLPLLEKGILNVGF